MHSADDYIEITLRGHLGTTVPLYSLTSTLSIIKPSLIAKLVNARNVIALHRVAQNLDRPSWAIGANGRPI